MRIWHVLVLVFLVAIVLSVSHSEYGRITLVLFLTGIGEVVLGATALMNLFKTVGAFGRAQTLMAHVEALAATALILAAASIGMTAVLWFGGVVLQMVASL
jgi:hypothetical protein